MAGYVRWRRLIAALGVVALVGTLAGSSPFADAAENAGVDKVWVGDDCPGGDWECQADGPVVLEATDGRDLEAYCTLDDCVLNLSNTTGSNTASCDQEATANGELRCEFDLSNAAGANSAVAKQRSSVSSGPLSLTNVTQDSRQVVTSTITNGSGTNDLDVDQVITHQAAAAVKVLDGHLQEAHQHVEVVRHTSDSGDQTISVNQHEVQTSNANAVSVSQEQNVREEFGQSIVIGQGQGSLGMDTTSGTNLFNYHQRQDFTQSARGLGGLTGALLSASQTIGAINEDYPAALVDWTIDSRRVGGSEVVGEQIKNWTQDTTPDTPPLGKTQRMFDELAIIGQLFTTDYATTGQQATLVQDGGYRRCVQLADVHAEVSATNGQNCNGKTQTATGKHIKMRLAECRGQVPPGDECDEDSSFVEIVEPEEPVGSGSACGQGFWSNNTDLWHPDVDPGDRFGDHFSGAEARFAALADQTMLEAINSSGGGSTTEGAAGNMARHAVAGLLNALHPDVPYQMHSKTLRSEANEVLVNGSRNDILGLASTLEGLNSGDCAIA